MNFFQREQGLILPLLILVLMGIWGYFLAHPAPVPDFSDSANVQAKKDAFFAYLKPHIEAINKEIASDRAQILNGKNGFFGRLDNRRIKLQYLNSEENSNQKLLLRVDEVPASLALVQAAKESGWGSSRFAREGYNFFGQQCFQRGCGFTPRNRTAGLRHEVAKFKSVRAAVRSYIHNLNTHPQYEAFRAIRAELRAKEAPLSGITLAQGLESYSERGLAYVEEVQAMIRANHLE